MKSATRWTPVAWAQACDARNTLDRLWMGKWPVKSMTRREAKTLERALERMDEARSEIMLLQSSLAERSKLAGYDTPDFERYREQIGA